MPRIFSSCQRWMEEARQTWSSVRTNTSTQSLDLLPPVFQSVIPLPYRLSHPSAAYAAPSPNWAQQIWFMELTLASLTAGQNSQEQINISQQVTHAFRDRIRPVEISKSFITDLVKTRLNPYLQYEWWVKAAKRPEPIIQVFISNYLQPSPEEIWPLGVWLQHLHLPRHTYGLLLGSTPCCDTVFAQRLQTHNIYCNILFHCLIKTIKSRNQIYQLCKAGDW